ncbi:MAG: hypothetical protein JW818_01010 [Pirellulales bacterium]|nr:hypothetical protein [Pirellulales bacterium]
MKALLCFAAVVAMAFSFMMVAPSQGATAPDNADKPACAPEARPMKIVCCPAPTCQDGWYYEDAFGLRPYNPWSPVTPSYMNDPDIHQWSPWLVYR